MLNYIHECTGTLITVLILLLVYAVGLKVVRGNSKEGGRVRVDVSDVVWVGNC